MGDVVRGPWQPHRDFPVPGSPPAEKVRWRRGRPIAPDALRKHCTDCHRPFDPKGWVPADLLCGDCRDERAEAAADAAMPTLFDPES